MNEERKCGMRTYVYSEVLFSHLRKEILPFAATQMELEGTMLCNQTVKTNTVRSHMWNLKKKPTTLYRNKEKTFGYWGWRWKK